MSETNKKIPFSTIRKDLREIMKKTGNAGPAVRPVDFIPCDLKIWIGHDSDFFHRAFCHHRMILKIILTGKASTCIDGIRYRLAPSDAVLYFPMQTHSTEITDQGTFEYLAISFIVGRGKYEALDVLRHRVFTPDPENCFLQRILRAWKENNQMHAEFLLAELLSSAVARHSGENAKTDNDFGQIAEYIRKNSSGVISVKKIAAEFGISPQSVRRIFQRNINGLTPGKLIRQQRLILAEELLLRTDFSLQEIAEKCGFSTAFSFSRAFCREYGVPPAQYRKNSQN